MEIHEKSCSVDAEDMDRGSSREKHVKKLRTRRSWKFLGKVNLENVGQEFGQDSDRRRERQSESTGSVKVKVTADARSYRKWHSSRITKTEMPDVPQKVHLISQGGDRGHATKVDASNDVEEEVVAEKYSLSSSKKRQSTDFNLKSQSHSCVAKLCEKLTDISFRKVVRAQECIARSPPRAKTAVSDIKNGISVSKEAGRTESISGLSGELTEEDSDVAWGEKSYTRPKNGVESNGCAICMLGGELLCCVGKGCQRNYHLSCLNPPLVTAPPGVWHCTFCVEKKMNMGVHSVSKGVESIWGVREVASDNKGRQKHMEYLVKHQGLAHVHNLWIPEKELLLESPTSVAKFNRRSQAISWKTEWSIPQRLLQKRQLSFSKHPTNEWLVKWTGLSYDHATWELENASFLTSPEAKKLKQDYEDRHAKAERKDDENCHDKADKMQSLSQANEEGELNICTLYAYQSRKANFSRLSQLPSGDSPGAYNHYLKYVNKLREHWYKGHNAIVFDDQADQERILKVILFILSLQHTVQRPLLIISSANTLSVWEAEFLRVASSVNFIVYEGNKDVRNSIRSLEFYNEGCKIMFQVLLTSSRIVVEDLELLKSIAWRTIIIDECQRSTISRHFKQFKMIAADMRLLISSQFKDNSAYYISMLSLINSRDDELNNGNMKIHDSADIAKLKEILAPYTAYECKSDSFCYEEYWVPVQLSNVQLEQYCAVLLSNPVLLFKNDTVDSLRESIISIRKCCDHPYLLDKSLQSVVREGLPAEEYLDAEIQVSGKLLLLEKILLEMKGRGLRVLIIFQSIGCSGRESVGDILEEFVCQRFGEDCWVRIDGNSGVYRRSKKQAALNMFNSKDSEKFVFLIENRACLPSIKLSSVDAIILFDSDWDPQNDLKALHRISISSQFEKLKVFRLYSCYTVEERALIHAKKSGSNENNVDYMNRDSCYSLLSWGLARLFNKLDDFHQCKTLASGSKIYSEWPFLDDVLQELLNQLLCNRENEPSIYSFISRAQQDTVAYAREISVIGEKEVQDTEPPAIFWKNLLDGRHPRWRFLCQSSTRIRSKVNYVDNLPSESELENHVVAKKRRNVANNQGDSVHQKSRLKRKRSLVVAGKEHEITAGRRYKSFLVADSSAMHPVADDIKGALEVNVVEFEKENVQHALLKSTQSSMKLEIMELCDVLKLPENVKATCLTFFDYIMSNYNVSWETGGTLEAFQISLCWTAASLLKYKIDHEESLSLAKLYLKFECEEVEANYIYSILKNIKKKFGFAVENIKMVKESNNSKNSKSSACNQQGLEEGKLTISFWSQNLSHELIDLEDGEIPMSSNPMNDSKSTEFKQQDLEEGEIHGESKRLSGLDKLLDLEEGEIQVCSNSSNNNISTKFYKQDLEEGEIPTCPQINGSSDELMELEEGEIPASPQSRNLLDQMGVHSTVKQRSACEILDGKLKEKDNDSNCKMEMPQYNVETSQLASRIVEEQLKADEMVKVEKATGKLVTSCFPESELKIDNMQPAGFPIGVATVRVDSQNGVPRTVPYSANHCKTLLMVPSEASDFSSIQNKIFETSGRIMEEHLKADEIVQVKKATEKPVALVDSLCSSGSTSKIDNMQPTNTAMNGVSGNCISEATASSSVHCKNIRIVSLQLSDFSPNENESCKTTARIVNAEEIVQLEIATEKPVTSLGGLCPSDSEFKVDNMQPTHMATGHVGSQEGICENMQLSPNHCKPVTMPSQLSDFPPNEKKLYGSPVVTVTGTIESNEEDDEVEAIVSKNLASTCIVQNNEVNSSTHCLNDGTPVLISTEKQRPGRNVQIIDSVARPDDPISTIPEVIMGDEPMYHDSHAYPVQKRSLVMERPNVSEVREDSRVVTAAVESNEESDEVEVVVSKSLASSCRIQNNEVNSSTHGLKDDAPVLTLVEKQSPDKDVNIIDSAVRPDDNPQSTFCEVVIVDEPMDHSSHAFLVQNQSLVMGRANLSEIGQDSRAVTPVCTENLSLEFTGTSSSVVHPDTSAVQRNAIPLNQIPIPTVSFSSAHSSPDASTFMGIQNRHSSASHASTQEVQVSRQLLSKDLIEFANARVQGLPLPPSRSTQRSVNEPHVHGPRTRTSMNNPSFHTNHVIPDIPQLACSDPLQIEIERILRDERHELKMHEDMVLHIISEREKEMREIFEKYEVLLQDAERAVQQKMEDHRTNLQYVYLSKLLAETLMLKHQDYKGAVPPDARRATASNLTVQSIQLSAQHPFQICASRFAQYPATRLGVSSVELIDQPPVVLSSSSARPHSSIGEFQNANEFRASASHRQASIASTHHLPILNNEVQNQHFPRSSNTNSMM